MTESAKAMAKRRYVQEEESGRQQRIAELEEEERRRREMERQERERQETLDAAREEAERLAFERGALEDQAEREMAALVRTLGELAALDKRHRVSLQAAGLQQPSMFLTAILQNWTAVRLSNATGVANHDWSNGSSLRERDPLAPSR